MKTWLSSLLALVLVSALAPAQPGDLKTRARLFADVTSIQPGKTFTVGILLSMAPRWHTYWKNPGESGMATTVAWTLPEGFQAGDIDWPVPEKTLEAGDVLTYGYAGETMLLVPVSAPPTIPPGTTITLKATVEWLECETTCVPGSANLELTLPVAAKPPASANESLFTRFRKEIPRPRGEAAGFTIAAEERGGVVSIRLSPAPQATPDFFPEPVSGYLTGRTSVRTDGNDAVLSVPLTVSDSSRRASSLRGVIVIPGTHGGTSLEIPLATQGKTGIGLLEQSFDLPTSSSGEQSLWLYLLFAVLGGLILNIMPCVLPVIALKVFGLVRMAGDRPPEIRKMGIFFSLGILASFLALAALVIILQVAGNQVGWGFQFQEPLFVIAMCAIVFAFGLSLFGVYEIRVPGGAISGVGSLLEKQEKGSGYGGSFLEGVFATILATPCTAPFLGSALGFAFSQPWWIILLIFTAVAFGMALPYLVLTMRPAWTKYLPKPGAWMETAKQFMGFLMMATLLWLLYVLGKQIGMEGVVWTGAFLLSIGISCWLVGRFATLSATRAKSRLTWALALLVAVGGYLWFLEGILDVRSVIAGTKTANETVKDDGIPWRPFALNELDAALQEGKGVFLDFTAEWCLTCKVNERTVLADRDVIEKLRTSGLIMIKADWTNRNPDITRLLRKFGRSGVPLYVIFPPGQPNRPIILPEVITPGIVLESINAAAPAR